MLIHEETNAVKNSWPSMVALVMYNETFCGGSLIDSIHVITAAHCVANFSERQISALRVALGMHSLMPVKDPQVTKTVLRVERHNDFDAKTYYNDIALLTLDSPVVFTETISPICLPPNGSTNQYEYRQTVVIGWGVTTKRIQTRNLFSDGTRPNVLQQITIQTITNAECRSRFDGVVTSGIAAHMICAFSPRKDACDGDSGGPLLVQDMPGNKWTQIGIVSWGIGCAESHLPGVYTRITSFVDWIEKQKQFDLHILRSK
ncbi:clotting factor G beta subunit-like [Daphnia carinata]|uniref:clotting factor G beta subunit-like n=1 Tax=Daphnia carinata TaxID=120202 RepID=UPI002868DF92|nr:clotting factor G beta subunit-like [Daphnia carinata]